jgi:NADPH:quinone reductase
MAEEPFMRAVVTRAPGSAPDVVEVAEPLVGPGEIRVKVHAASVNGFDLAVASGRFADVLPHEYPVVLGRDFAGIVDQVGEQVSRYALGDEVFGVVFSQPLHAGSFAEYLVVPERHSIAPVPLGLDLTTAGVIGLAGAAAQAILAAGAPRSGETVLISGATGGVGAFAIQYAVAAGAKVVATAAPGREADHVRALGAHHVVDRAGDVTAQVRALAPDGADVVLHLAGDVAALATLLVPGGRLASLLVYGPDAFAQHGLPPEVVEAAGIRTSAVVARPDPAVLDSVADAVASGRIRVPVQRAYGLAEVPQAFADFAAGTLGKLAIRVR